MRNGIMATLVSLLVFPLYLVLMLPYGLVARTVSDPLWLRFRRERATYYRLVRRRETAP
jgi:hypothetical protein